MEKPMIPILDLSADVESLWDELQVAIQGVLKLPFAEAIADEVLSLPMWPQISDEVQGRVVEAIRRCFS